MRYDKSVYAPAEEFTRMRIDPARTERGQTVTLNHMRPTKNGLVCAEGSAAAATLPSAVSRIYLTEDGVYAYESSLKSLYNVSKASHIPTIPTEPVAVLFHETETGIRGLYSVEKNAIRYIRGDTVLSIGSVGGSCAAMHHGRVFTADGRRLRFSAPFSPDGIVQTERDPDKAGYIDFAEGKGSIIALVSFRERLYVFFEQGIMKMRAEGEALNFDATEMPFRGGKILQGSVAACGDRICYMTASGLYSFNGTTADFLEEKRSEINYLLPIHATCFNGKYAAAVRLTNNRTALYVYDFSEKVGRFVLEKGMTAAEGDSFVAGTTLYRFSETGGASVGYDSSLALTLSTPPRAIAWVRVEGSGTFEIRTNAENVTYTAEGDQKVNIGSKKKFTETQISVTAKGAAFRIRAIEIAWRKEDGD